MEGIVVRRLREARRLLRLQQFLDYAIWALFAALAFVAAGRLAVRNLLHSEVFWLVALGCAMVVALAAALYRWRSTTCVARELDVRAKTKDRFLTALCLPPDERGALFDAARRETAAFAAKLRVADHLRPRVSSKKALWLLLPLSALAVLESFRLWNANRLAPELAMAQELVERAKNAAELEARKEEDLQQIVEQLQNTESKLAVSQEPMREALRALAELEAKLSAQSELDAAEIDAIAEALHPNHAELVSKLREGKNAEAAKAVAQLNPEEVAKALEQAARHLETNRLRELAKKTPIAARLQLVQMLGSLQRSDKGTAQRRVLAALRDMKSGTEILNLAGVRGETGAEAPPENPTQSLLSSDGGATGHPGSEHDLGRGRDITEEAERDEQPVADEDFVSGQIGEGASLVELFRAAGNDDPKARRAYQSAYQTAAPAALDAVSQEHIPAGSRLLVRRYFEAIRPKE
jgi:hypothetical protein